MRVLIFSNWFPPVASGSSFYASSLAQSLAARGHDVVVVTLDWGADLVPPQMPFPIHRLPVLRLPKLPVFYNLRLMGLAFTPCNRQRLKDIITQHRSQVVHHVNHIFDTTFLSISAARAAGVPIVGSLTTLIQHQNRAWNSLMAFADRWTVGRFGLCRWNGIVCLDYGGMNYVRRQYGEQKLRRCRFIPFGVRVESMTQYERPAQQRAERPTILFVGHIHPFRNPVQLVRAMALVKKQIPEARLVLAGRVDLPEPVQVAKELGLTGEQVQFLGETPHQQIVQLMKTSHAFASWVTGPYLGLGTAPMEAMLCETAVINDLPEDLFGEGKLKNGENIVLVNSRDPQSIAAAIVRLLTDDVFRQKIGAGGRRFVLEHLSWAKIAEQMEQLYTHVLAESAKAE